MIRFTEFNGIFKNGKVCCECGNDDLELIFRDLISDERYLIFRCRNCMKKIEYKYIEANINIWR